MEEAVYSDCYALIKNFVGKGSSSFKIFCKEWKKLYFQHMFTMQSTYIQVQQTVGCVFHFGKRIMCNRNATRDNIYTFGDFKENDYRNILQRIGALYLLYAVYFKQPLDQYTKIEVSLETWKQMKDFIKNILPSDQHEYDEARYVFWKLFKSQAFRFTALDYCVGLEGLVDYDDLDNTKSNSMAKSVDGINSLMEKRTNFLEVQNKTPALIALEKGYNEVKSELTKKHNLDGQLLPPTNIFYEIGESFKKIEKILNQTDEIDDCASGSNTKRRKLKDKAFGLQSNNATNSETEQEKSNQEVKNIKRMSARTIFAAKLPDDMYKDDTDDDSEEESKDSTDEKKN